MAGPAGGARRIHAALRRGERGPFDSLNVGAHVGDADAGAWPRTAAACAPPALCRPSRRWLEQVHGVGVVRCARCGAPRSPRQPPVARSDAAMRAMPRAARRARVRHAGGGLPAGAPRRARWVAVAAAHAGLARPGRGGAGGHGRTARDGPRRLIAWLGPAIGPAALRSGRGGAGSLPGARPRRCGRLRGQCSAAAGSAISCALARQRLSSARSRAQCIGGEWCTYSDPLRFFSYRRDGQCGRMAALVWLG